MALLFCVLGLGFGYFVVMLPAPADERQFWLANLTLPWLLLPFAAGWSQRSWRWAITTGTTALVLCVIGFYADLLGRNLSDGDAGNDLAGFGAVLPWLVAAVIAGPTFAALGRWWGKSRSLVPGLVMAAVPIAEPWMWRLRTGFLPEPTYLWLIETAVGLLLVGVVVWVHRRHRQSADGEAPLADTPAAAVPTKLG